MAFDDEAGRALGAGLDRVRPFRPFQVNAALLARAAADPVVPAVFSGNAIAAVRRGGGQPRYTEYDTSTYFFPMAHFAWVPAYQNEEMRAWMFQQSR